MLVGYIILITTCSYTAQPSTNVLQNPHCTIQYMFTS